MAHKIKQHDRKPSIRTFLGLAAARLATPLDATATQVAVVSARGVTTGLHRIEDEYVTVTTVSGNVLTVERAAEGSAATTHGGEAVVAKPALQAGDVVSFIMRLANEQSAPQVNAPATVESVPLSLVRYDWQVGDTAVSGRYEAEWERKDTDDLVQTFPTETYDEVVVYQDLDGEP